MYITNKTRRPHIMPIFLDKIVITEVHSHRDLGLIISNNLSWKEHINCIIEKALKRLNVISRYRELLPRSVLVNLYITMVRPVLEYCNIIYDNSPAYLKIKLENVQRRAALLCTGAYRHTESKRLLNELCWKSLGERRLEHKLVQFYKIINNIYPTYLKNLIPQLNVPLYNFRTVQQYKIPILRLTNSAQSFFPATSKVWNNLSPPIRNAPTLPNFKRLISGNKFQPNKYYNACSGEKGKMADTSKIRSERT